MHLDVLKNLKLGFEVALMNDLDKIAQHLGPKFVSRVRLVDYCCYIVP